MKHLKIFAVAVLVVLLVVSCQINQNKKQAQELAEKGWDIFLHPGLHLKPGDDPHKDAFELFEKAVALDSTNASALAGLAYRYIPSKRKEIGRSEAFEKAKYLATKATKIDPNSSLAFAVRGLIETWDNKDKGGAEEFYEKAYELDNSDVVTLAVYSDWLRWSKGDFERALELALKASKIDPENHNSIRAAANAYRFLGQYEKALEWADKAIKNYKSGGAYLVKVQILVNMKDYDSGLAVFKQSQEFYPKAFQLRNWAPICYVKQGEYENAESLLKDLNQQGFLGWLYALMGKRSEALEILDVSLAKEEPNAWGILWIYLALDDHENAILWLEKHYERVMRRKTLGNFKHTLNAWDEFKVLNAYPRFQALLDKVNSTKL